MNRLVLLICVLLVVAQDCAGDEQLTSKKCKACEGGVEPLNQLQANDLMKQLSSNWELSFDGMKIKGVWKMKDFVTAMKFLNDIAEVAESEQHHPDVRVFSYRFVEVELYTHAIGGLSENDFIVAAKVNQLTSQGEPLLRQKEEL